jgi:hypothetical protein
LLSIFCVFPIFCITFYCDAHNFYVASAPGTYFDEVPIKKELNPYFPYDSLWF